MQALTKSLLCSLAVGGFSATLLSASIYRDPSRSVDARVADLLERMTLAEKIGQLEQELAKPAGQNEAQLARIRAGEVSSFILALPPEEGAGLVNSFQQAALHESRLGIPVLFGFDSIHGYRTIFPIPLGLGATWDPDLVAALQAMSARETRAAGIPWVFAPMSDLARDVRWGRVAETFGEDPYLNSRLVAASVKGLQGDLPIAADRVAATLKHFVGYSAATAGRDYDATEIPEFVLRNAHLPAFHAGVDAGALTLMSSFNANDGIPAVANRHTLTEILRDDWGFRGFVVSDWKAVEESMLWGYAANAGEAARRALSAGNDMEMLTTTFRDTLPEQIRTGALPLAVVDEAVRRVLRVKFQLGLFENPSAEPGAPARAHLRPASLTLARQAAARSIVLLKNTGILPLAPTTRRVALIGPLGEAAAEMLGSWRGMGRHQDVVTLAAGLRARLGDGAELISRLGCPLAPLVEHRQADGEVNLFLDPVSAAADPVILAEAVSAARLADVVIMALGEPAAFSGEYASRATLALTGAQNELFAAVAATGKPLIAVIFSGRPLELTHLAAQAAAILEVWQPGLQAGHAIADVLFGEVAPTGRLPISFPRSVGQVPIYYNGFTTGRPGYKHYRDFPREPLYPFGFGLTYTTFRYGAVSIESPAAAGHPWLARASVTNTGNRAGEEVVQLYIRDLACSEGARPQQELRGWQRLPLAPGETREVRFELTDAVLGFVNRHGRWTVEPGDFQVWIAPHAATGEPAAFKRR